MKQKTRVIYNGKMIFIQGSLELDLTEKYLQEDFLELLLTTFHSILKNRLPLLTATVLMIGKKINAIVEETINEDMTLISGIPPWVQTILRSTKKVENQLNPYF